MTKKTSGTFSSFDNTDIYYEVRGDGEPIVFVYGVACLMNHWRYQTSYFSKSHSVVTFDLRGHHNSSVSPNFDFTVESMAKDLIGLCEHLNIDNAHFVGHSFGSQILIYAHHLNPKIVKSITFFNGFSNNPFQRLAKKESLNDFLNKVALLVESYPKPIKNIWEFGIKNPIAVYISYLLGGFSLTAIKDIEIYAKGVSNIQPKYFVQMLKQLISFEGSHFLEEIQKPVLVIGGTKDSITPISLQKAMLKKLPTAQWVLVPHGSHCTQLDFPDYSNLLLEKFFRSLS